MAEYCVFPAGEFVWGTQVCGEEAVTLIRDNDGNDGWVCAEHATMLNESSRYGRDCCVGDNDTCMEEPDWSRSRPGVDLMCTRHAEEWEADHAQVSRRSFLGFLRG